MILCIAGDIHGGPDRMYAEVLAFEAVLSVRFDWILHVGDFGVGPDPGRILASIVGASRQRGRAWAVPLPRNLSIPTGLRRKPALEIAGPQRRVGGRYPGRSRPSSRRPSGNTVPRPRPKNVREGPQLRIR